MFNETRYNFTYECICTVVSATNLRMIFESFEKEVHNILIKNLDHKDRQNFHVVDHLTIVTVLLIY